jgi:selenide, water dikinase
MGAKATLALASAIVGLPISMLTLETLSKILVGGASICRPASAPIPDVNTNDSVESIYGLIALGLVHRCAMTRGLNQQGFETAAYIGEITPGTSSAKYTVIKQ